MAAAAADSSTGPAGRRRFTNVQTMQTVKSIATSGER